MPWLGERADTLGDALPAGRRALGYLWAAPNTLVGLLAAATVRARPVRWRGVLLLEGARGGIAWYLARRKFAAITLGHVIITNKPVGDRLLAHELAHVAQHERWGIGFYPAYLLTSLRGYERNPFEQAARRLARSIAERRG
jgi:Domain of unknown function (DUF4157)